MAKEYTQEQVRNQALKLLGENVKIVYEESPTGPHLGMVGILTKVGYQANGLSIWIKGRGSGISWDRIVELVPSQPARRHPWMQ